MNNLFNQDLKVINIGTVKFNKEMEIQQTESVQVNWQPPAGGNIKLLNALDLIADNDKIEEANKEVIKRMKDAHPYLIDIGQALDVIPGMHARLILHSGPPITWERMAGPVKGAIIGALIFEELAHNEEEAVKLIEAGEIEFAPCNEHSTVGPMAGIVSPSMPVHVIENVVHGNRTYCTVNEGLGKVSSFWCLLIRSY